MIYNIYARCKSESILAVDSGVHERVQPGMNIVAIAMCFG